MSILYFQKNDESFYVSEWGHTLVKKSTLVGPYRCQEYLLHFNHKGTSQFLGKTVLEGQAFFIPKRARYTFTVSENYDHYWFSFSGSRAESFLKHFGIDPYSPAVIDVNNADFYSSYSKDAFLQCTQTGSSQIATAVLFSLLSLCQKTTKSSNNTADVEFAAEIMENNYYKDLKVSDVADAIRLEQKYFTRKFKKRFGISPINYLTDIRIKQSCILLIEEKYMIKEIAFLCGYNSSLSFNTAFKRKMGISPINYRDKFKK